MNLIQQGADILFQIGILLGLFLLRTLKGKVQTFVDAKTTVQQRQMLTQLGKEAFAYAETVYRGHDGPAKLNEALKYLLDRCDSSGLCDVHMKEARAVIESAWIEDKRKTGQPINTMTTSSVSEEAR
jgi:hypothetical protein